MCVTEEIPPHHRQSNILHASVSARKAPPLTRLRQPALQADLRFLHLTFSDRNATTNPTLGKGTDFRPIRAFYV
ncbi:hypothetical protein PsAD46_00863 [Pseudovibrio sp. Ad46]|nr:hypothetical protein PsAD46_00863 [Pseudovibrio sp. Ad46]